MMEVVLRCSQVPANAATGADEVKSATESDKTDDVDDPSQHEVDDTDAPAVQPDSDTDEKDAGESDHKDDEEDTDVKSTPRVINRRSTRELICFDFELVGVLIHSGTTESGHYYSFIKDRNGSNSSQQWYRFDDGNITPFEAANQMPVEAFGGLEEIIVDGGKQFGGKETVLMEKTRSAYMLFYQQKLPASTAVHSQSVVEDAATTLRYTPLDASIWADTRQLMRDKHLFDARFFDFMWHLVPQSDLTVANGDSISLEYPRTQEVQNDMY
jgi:hypothetical protein